MTFEPVHEHFTLVLQILPFFRRFKIDPLKMWTKIHTLSEGSSLGAHRVTQFLDLFCLVILILSTIEIYHGKQILWGLFFKKHFFFYALQLKCYCFFVSPFWGCSTNQPRKGWGKFCVFLVWPGADWSTCAYSISTSSGGLCRVIWNGGWVGGHFWAWKLIALWTNLRGLAPGPGSSSKKGVFHKALMKGKQWFNQPWRP